MTVKITRIGNSRGIRIPREVLELYRLADGDELELESGPDGITLTPRPPGEAKLSLAESYREMAMEAAEATPGSDWGDWDTTAGDGFDD